MSETPATEAPAREPDEATIQEVQPVGDSETDSDTDWKAEARKWQRYAKGHRSQVEKIAAALGIPAEPDEGGEGLAAKVQRLQQQFEQAQWATSVESAARRHGITSDEDIDLLRIAPSEEALAKLAERLRPSLQDHPATPPRTPKPDPSVGKGNHGGNRPSSVAQAAEEYRQRTKKTNA